MRLPTRNGTVSLSRGAAADATRRTKPIPLLWRVENAFAQLGRWRLLSRRFEGTTESARAWLEVACVGYVAEAARLVDRQFDDPLRARGEPDLPHDRSVAATDDELDRRAHLGKLDIHVLEDP